MISVMKGDDWEFRKICGIDVPAFRFDPGVCDAHNVGGIMCEALGGFSGVDSMAQYAIRFVTPLPVTVQTLAMIGGL